MTAQLPADLQAWANDLRRRHFPPERNFLQAHVTLFHALPRAYEAEVRRALADMAGEYSAPSARLEGIFSLGGGTALKLVSEEMLAVRDELAERFHGLLTAQDQHRPRLHITVQNKVSPAEAKALQAELSQQVEPRDFCFSGLELNIYRGGPWDFVRDWRFRGG